MASRGGARLAARSLILSLQSQPAAALQRCLAGEGSRPPYLHCARESKLSPRPRAERHYASARDHADDDPQRRGAISTPGYGRHARSPTPERYHPDQDDDRPVHSRGTSSHYPATSDFYARVDAGRDRERERGEAGPRGARGWDWERGRGHSPGRGRYSPDSRDDFRDDEYERRSRDRDGDRRGDDRARDRDRGLRRDLRRRRDSEDRGGGGRGSDTLLLRVRAHSRRCALPTCVRAASFRSVHLRL